MDVLTARPDALEGTWDGIYLDDEPLVAFAQKPAGAPALHELLRRFSARTGRLVGRLAVRSGFQGADRLDAQQEAVFWTLEAVRLYRTDDRARTRGCRFRSFLHRVVTARFIDYLRRQRRRVRLIAPGSGFSTRVAHDIAVATPDGPGELELTDVRKYLERGLRLLGPVAQHLWELLAQGVSLRRAAAELGISYDIAKRQRRGLLARLRAVVAS